MVMTTELKEYMDARFDRLERAARLGNKEVLDIEEAAMLTGYKVKGIYEMTSQRRIPHYKKNGKLYFKKSELEAWMTEQKVLTEAEIRGRAVTYSATHKRPGK